MWTNLLRLIISDIFDVNIYNQYINYINTPSNTTGCYPLHFAVISENSHQIVPYLIQHGAKINVENNYGESILHWACKQGDINIIQYLINNKAQLNACDDDEASVLHWAAEYNHPKVIELLLSYGLDKNLMNADFQTPLDIAKYNDSMDCVILLQENNNNTSYMIIKNIESFVPYKSECIRAC